MIPREGLGSREAEEEAGEGMARSPSPSAVISAIPIF